jgi:hypothetical protein
MYFTTAKSCEIKNIGKPEISLTHLKDLKPAPEQICPMLKPTRHRRLIWAKL